jgi:hypothetical protein
MTDSVLAPDFGNAASVQWFGVFKPFAGTFKKKSQRYFWAEKLVRTRIQNHNLII